MTDRELDGKLAAILSAHNAAVCPGCGPHLDRGDLAWNNGCTEYGTPNAMLEVICQQCDTEIVCLTLWYPHIDDLEEAIEVLEDKWDD